MGVCGGVWGFVGWGVGLCKEFGLGFMSGPNSWWGVPWWEWSFCVSMVFLWWCGKPYFLFLGWFVSPVGCLFVVVFLLFCSSIFY